MPPIYRVICLIAFVLLFTSPAWSAQPDGKSLSPQKAEAIQSIGRAVLQAKKSLTPDPEAQELRQSAEALKAAIDEDVSISAPPNPAQAVISGTAVPRTTQAQNTGGHTVTDSSEFRQRLDHFRVQQADVESRMLARAKTKAKLEKRPAYPILLQLRQMRDELDQALTAPQEERHQRLAHLKRRLDTKVKAEQQHAPGDQPQGLKTLVRHYRNEQVELAPTSPRP